MHNRKDHDIARISVLASSATAAYTRPARSQPQSCSRDAGRESAITLTRVPALSRTPRHLPCSFPRFSQPGGDSIPLARAATRSAASDDYPPKAANNTVYVSPAHHRFSPTTTASWSTTNRRSSGTCILSVRQLHHSDHRFHGPPRDIPRSVEFRPSCGS